MLCYCNIEEKDLLLLCISKWLRRDNRMKVSALLRSRHKVSEVANLVGLAQPSTRWRSAWTMAKASPDVQAVVERLLSLEWHPASCPSNGIPVVTNTKFDLINQLTSTKINCISLNLKIFIYIYNEMALSFTVLRISVSNLLMINKCIPQFLPILFRMIKARRSRYLQNYILQIYIYFQSKYNT